MVLAAGARDRRIRLERAHTTRDALNHPVETWMPLASRWAEKRDVSDRERLALQSDAPEIAAQITTRFRILWSADVASLNPKDRVVFEGRVFDIKAVKEIGTREGLEISAMARADL